MAYFYQEQLRADVERSPQLLALATKQRVNLVKQLTPGNGAEVDLDWVSLAGDLEPGHASRGFLGFRDEIGLNKSSPSDPKLFKLRLLHETGHLNGRPPIDQATQEAMYERLLRTEAVGLGITHPGYVGFAYTWILYGSLLGE